jgi:hypothetical protein
MQWLRSPNYLDNCNQWFTMRLGRYRRHRP